jgi:CRISPR-associated endonuclease/helicase Cas3
VFDLDGEGPNNLDSFESHPDKPLRVHTNGVLAGVRRRTELPSASVAALFHDFGKLNPNFQKKLAGETAGHYSNHAYLSAHAFLCFCKANACRLPGFGITSGKDVFTVVHAIARHHGNLNNLRNALSPDELQRLLSFLRTGPSIPAAEFLGAWQSCNPFNVCDEQNSSILFAFETATDKFLDKIDDKIDYYLKQQFGFACLVESDKRDAGNLLWHRRSADLDWAKNHFGPSVAKLFAGLAVLQPLDVVRNDIRDEAVSNLVPLIENGERIFSLTSPTGSGKTFTLIALANQIREARPDHSVMYCLPFLSITEQVEDVCRDNIFKSNPCYVTRIDSRTENVDLENILKALDADPSRIAELLARSFSADTFDAGFIVTTFVQFFETLLSNRGSVLLRLPNFSKCIFLIDEFQALPPRLYVFFAAYLQVFCKLVDSYAILSTATMPSFDPPRTNQDPARDVAKLFAHYTPPTELLSFEAHFRNPVFNRYRISPIDNGGLPCTMRKLSVNVREQGRSTLVILNTIDDTRLLFSDLTGLERGDWKTILLNTHFTLEDRQEKIKCCKERLAQGERTVLVSTQLIEAGVDIDFPVVYRDLCPLPNLIQSAGRCNRNNSIESGGIVKFFELCDDSGKPSAAKVYRGRSDKWILDFSREHIVDTISEHEMLCVQRQFFDMVNDNLAVGDHPLQHDGTRNPDNLIRRINDCAFETVGSFRLIDPVKFGKEYQIFVPNGDEDLRWENLRATCAAFARASESVPGGRLSFADSRRYTIAIDSAMKRMAGRIAQIRTTSEAALPPCVDESGETKEVCGIRKLTFPDIDYSPETGIKLNGAGTAIL